MHGLTGCLQGVHRWLEAEEKSRAEAEQKVTDSQR